MNAKDLIENKKKMSNMANIPDTIIKEIKTILEYNDTVGRAARVSVSDVLAMCKSQGAGITRDGLNKICINMGRRSFSVV